MYNKIHIRNTRSACGLKDRYSSCLALYREEILMGKQSTRENKTIYQLCREAAGLTRAEASEKMNAVSASKIEKFEYETFSFFTRILYFVCYDKTINLEIQKGDYHAHFNYRR